MVNPFLRIEVEEPVFERPDDPFWADPYWGIAEPFWGMADPYWDIAEPD